MVPLLRGKGSDGENSKERGRNKMKWMVLVVVIAVFACALFLVPNVSACKLVIEDSGVVPSSGNVTDKFTYWVNVTNEGWFSCWDVEVKLTYGPNRNNRDCNDSRTKNNIGISDGENRNITFRNIQLEPLKRCDDEFKNFTDGKKGWRWDKYWYKFEIAYPGGHLPPEWGWEPILKEIRWELRDEEVDPPTGTNEDRFTYSVRINASKKSPVELLVYNYSSGEFEFKKTENYEKTMHWQPIKFENIELSPSELSLENDSKYIFKYRGNNETSYDKVGHYFSGPTWPINETWKNPTVKPESGLYNSKFTYCLDVKADKKMEVKLIPYYPTKGEATIPPTEEYIDAGNWTTICWNDTHPFEEKDEGTAEYKFKFYYEHEINDTEKCEGCSRYSGPSIGIAEFKNNSVKPGNGTRETEFTYSVNVSAVESDYLYLKVYDSGGTLIREKKSDKKTSPNWEVFEFKNVTFEHVPPAALGNASYEFWVKKTPSIDYVGPFLIIEKIENFTVTPKEGTNATSFTFCVDVNSTEKENVTLQVSSNETKWIDVCSRPYEDDSKWKHICFPKISIDSSNLTPEEKENLISGWKKNKVIFWRVKGIIRESNTISTDWDINLTCHNRSFSPKEGWWYQDNFTFQVNLSANMNGDIELRIKLNESNSSWTTVGKGEYNNSPNPQILTWENVSICDSDSPYEGNTSYNFTLLWDSREDSCGSELGPRLFIPIDIQFKNASVTPEVGIYYIENDILWNYFKNRNTNYTYCVNVSAAKDTRIRPVIIDPTDKRTHGSERNYSTGTKPEELCWTINLSAPENICWGMWNYTFEYFDTRKKYENETGDGWVEWENQSEGPEHIAVFKNFDIDPKPPLLYGESCNVSVVVNGSKSKNFNITLELCNSTTCKPVETKTYNSSKGEQPIVWDGIKPWENFSSSDKLFFNFNVSGGPSIEEVPRGFSMLPAAQNPKVTPRDGYWDTSYNYSVEIKFDREIDVELWILKYGGKYYKGRPKTYKKVTQREPIYWNVSPFDPGCKMWDSQFNVTWNGTPLYIREAGELKPIRIYGPYIWDRPPVVKFQNGVVSMEKDVTYEDKLNYSVEVSVDPAGKDVEVALWVYDPCYGDRFMGYGHHSGSVDGWQKFTWSNKMPFYDERCKEGHSEFWFKAYDRNDKFINESQKWQGPDLIPLIEFSNASVAPEDGKYNARYNYSVNITINRPELVDINDIKLVVWNPYTKSEQEYPSGNVTNLFDRVKKIWWNETPFKDYTSCRGTAKYYFDYNGDIWPEKVLCDGPTIGVSTSTSSSGGGGGGGGSYGRPEKIYDNASVEPDPVEMGIRRESRTFNYSVEETKGYKLILEVYDVSSGKWEEKGEGVKSKHNGKWKHEWTVNLTLDCNWEGRGKYRFYPEKQGKYASQVYYGPDYKLPEGSTDIWKKDIPVSDTCLHKPNINAHVEPKEGMWFKKFTYTAEIMHPDKADMTVVLFVYKPESDDWVPVAKGRRYNYIINTSDYDEHNKATVMWTVDWENVFDEGDARESQSGFYIWYWDGWNEVDCEKSEREGYNEGPDLLANHEPQVAKLPEFNYVVSTSTEFEYRFDVEDDVNDTVYGQLTVIDPLNNSHSLSKDEKTGNNGVASLCFTVDPDFSEIFTEDKLNQTGNDTFTSRYCLEYWDECREMMGIGERFRTDWFTGPTVTAVNVTYTEPEVSPKNVTYADEFEIRMEFYSSKTNTISLTLTIYDPSNRSPPWSPPEGVVDLKVPAGQTEPVSWRVKPEIFGPEDAGKYVNYTIEGTDSFRRVYKINGNRSEFYIERAVPLSSFDPPLVPMVSMVIVPLIVIGTSLLSVLSGVPVSSLLKRGLGKLRKEREKGEEKKKEKET